MPIRHKISRGAVRIIGELQDAGYVAYIVGGAVRDLLLGRDPKDYDIATNATPEEVKRVFRRRARIIGRRFRLVHVHSGPQVYEVSTFRREPTEEERKGRQGDDGVMVWRDNAFGSLEEDARRRDFTVNALYYDPCGEVKEVTDFVGGVADINARCVRTIGDPVARLAEDPVRMLRACKLVGQYGFELEPQLKAEMQQQAAKLALSSSARLLEEIFKILKKPHTLAIFEACHQVGLLRHLLPQLGKDWDTPPGRHCRALLAERDRAMLEGALYPSRMTGMAMLILPFIEAELREPDDDYLWRNFSGIDHWLQEEIRDFFQPYAIPRYSVAKVRDILLLLPKFLSRRQGKLRQSAEYTRARDTFMVYHGAAGMAPELLAPWPPGEHRRES